MSAQVFISPDGTSAPTPYSVNTGTSGRQLRSVLDSICLLTGAAFPETGRITVNDETPDNLDRIIINGDHIKVSNLVRDQEIIEVPGAEKIKEEKKKEKEAEKKAESKGEAGAAGAPAPTKPAIKVDFSNLVSEINSSLEQLACLKQDIEQLEKIQKDFKDLNSKISKVSAAATEHISKFEAVLEAGVNTIREKEARINT